MVGGNKVVATLRADGRVYPDGFMSNLNLINYKIRTEADMANKLNTLNVATTVVDLGKQLLQYARDSDLKGVRSMLTRGAPFTSDWLGMSALHFAAMNNQYEICDALLKGGINKDSKTKVDRTPLHLACYYGNDRIVELLLAKKCSINPRDMLRMTPLHWAVEKRHKKIVRLLLEHNADVTVESKFGRTPIAMAVLTEQADLLDELKAAKQLQVNRKLNDEQEDVVPSSKKETSDAVNSIIGHRGDVQEDMTNALNRLENNVNDDYAHSRKNSDTKIVDFSNVKETEMLDSTAIDLLKSHGITMMQDDENDSSKELLSTVLRNGRQLVLTEGGKLLLNEANRKANQNDVKSTLSTCNNNNNNNNNNSNNNNINSSNNNNNINNNNNNTVTIPNSKYGQQLMASLRNQHIPPTNKIRTGIITKSKDTNTVLGKNKNIRIISLHDFKRLYGNTNLKAIQKLPTLPNTRTVRKLSTDAKGVERKVVMNMGQLTNRQMNSNNINEKENPTSDIIEIEPTDSEAELNDIDHRVSAAIATTGATAIGGTALPTQTAGTTIAHPSLRVLSGTASTRRIMDSQTGNTISVRPFVPAMTKSASTTSHQAFSNTTNNLVNSKEPPAIMSATALTLKAPTTTTATTITAPSLIPLLSVPEICRQLYELRKQNEELRRKFDFVQKEKEEMRQRLERLEELLLVERTAEYDYTQS